MALSYTGTSVILFLYQIRFLENTSMQARKIVFLLLCLFNLVVSTASEPHRISGIYSNLRFNREGGDLLGMELLIFPSRNGNMEYVVLVQISEGGAPFSALVPIKITGTKLEFTLPPGGVYDLEHFTGTLKGTGLVVRWSQGQIEELKRGKSYWQ